MALSDYIVTREPDGATIRTRACNFINDRGFGQFERFLFPSVADAVRHLEESYDYEVNVLGQEVVVR